MADRTEELYLRCAERDDVPALAHLRAISMIERGALAAHEAPGFTARAEREIAALLRAERLSAWVLVADGRVAGCACVVYWDRLPFPGSSRHAEIAGVYVDPAFRRRGIARELVGEALASARAEGVRRVLLAPTERTGAFYRSLGFRDSGWLRA